MKRILRLGLMALSLLLIVESSAHAFGLRYTGFSPNPNRRVPRFQGYWGNPSTGPLYDYSSYFANKYPQMYGSAEYQWRPDQAYPGSYSTYPLTVHPR